MTYIIKRKLQGVLGDDVDTNEMAALIQHTQDSAVEYIINQDSLTVNNLVVKKTNKIPVGTDKYPAANPSSTAISSVIETKDIVSNNFHTTYNCIKLADGFYMMGYKDNDSDGHVVTFGITESTGDITGTIDDWEFANGDTTNSVKIIKISGTMYAILYSRSQSANRFDVRTFTVSDAGVITKSFIEAFIVPTVDQQPVAVADIINISGDIYAIAWGERAGGAAGTGYVATISITSAGVISDTAIDSVNHSVDMKNVSIVRVGATDFYAIAYDDEPDNISVYTIEIDSAGNIAAAGTIQDKEIATGTLVLGNMVRVPGTDFYAIAADDGGTAGYIFIVSISSSGAITIKGSGFYDLNDAESGRILAVRGDLFTIVYRGVDNDGFIVTVPINSDGTVGLIADSLEFETIDTRTPQILSLGSNNYIITYGVSSLDDIRGATLTITPSVESAGFTWNEGSNLRSFDENGIERKYVHYDDGVLNADFDANTILKADTDDTPVALTVTEQTLVGRQTGGNIAAVPIGITDNDIVEIDSASVASGEYAKFTAAGLESKSFPEVLSDLSGQATATFDWNDQELDNIKTLNITDGTELTISSGAVTATQGHHSVDTEADASTDDLDTINGLDSNDLLLIFANNGTRTVRIRDGVGNIFLRHQNAVASYNFNSPAGSSGVFYVGGSYFAPAGEAALTQPAGHTQTLGSANVSYAAHAFAVAKGDGATDGSDLVLTVTGTSIDDEGNRNASDSEVVVADALLATFATDTYMETSKKWIGQVTYTLTSSGGGTFNCSFNYGFAKYEDFGNQDYSVTFFECTGRAGANDTGFNIKLYYHSPANWTYSAAAFVPGGTVLANHNTDHSTEKNLANGEPINYKRVDLNQDVNGNDSEGLVVEITTGANKAVEQMDIHVGVHTIPKYLYLADATQHVLFMKHGSNFHQV